MEITGEAGAGMVKITLDKKGYAVKVELDEFIFEQHDKQMLGDVFMCALNNAYTKLDQMSKLYTDQLKSLMPQYGSNIGDFLPK